jgi:hypothetical protein
MELKYFPFNEGKTSLAKKTGFRWDEAANGVLRN